jgi:transcriptional regulator with XRE-family HTH domain
MTRELIGHGIKRIRRYMGLKQIDLAESLNISSGYLSEIECGKKNPGIEILNKLVDKYKVNISYLFTGKGSYFIHTGKESSNEPYTNKKEISEEKGLLEEMKWYIKNIAVVRFALIGFFKNYLYEKRGMIKEEVEKYHKENPEEKNK